MSKSRITDEVLWTYSREAYSFAKYPSYDGHLPVANYPPMALAEETAELLEKYLQHGSSISDVNREVIKELGDCIWNINALCCELDLELTRFYWGPPEPLSALSVVPFPKVVMGIHAMVINAGKLVGMQAKCERDGAPFGDDWDKWIHTVELLIQNYIFAWCQVCEIWGVSPEEVLESNLKKLRDRALRNVIGGSGDHR